MKIGELVIGKEYRFSDDAKNTLIGKHVKIVEVDIKSSNIVVEMLEDSQYSRKGLDNFKKGQNINVSFASILEEIA